MANIVRIIEKKRDGVVLTKDEIQYYITSIVDGSIQDSQLGKYEIGCIIVAK